MNDGGNNDFARGSHETRLLNDALLRICKLLALEYGPAGSSIISNTIFASSSGEFNPLVPGKRIECAFAFCDIRDFTNATEILQEEVMEFVNTVAAVCHSEAARYGAPLTRMPATASFSFGASRTRPPKL